jgi:RNase P protein component
VTSCRPRRHLTASNLAEAIAELPTNNDAASRNIALRIALAAARTVDSVRDLDAFEVLPANISQETDIQAVIRNRAKRGIEEECEQLRQATNDAAAIVSAAHDLDQRARFYCLEIGIAPILDHADNLADEADADWPDALDEEPAELGEDPRVTMHQLFLRLDDDGVSE